MADRTISYLFRGDFRNFQAGLTAAGRGVQDFGGRLTALDRDGERMRRGLSKIGDGAGKVGLAAAAGLGAIVLATANFDKAMSRVSAATNATASDLGALRKAAIAAGADTVFSASEAADGITELGKAGLTTKDILGGGLTGALNLAAAGQISVADAANTTATTLQQFSLSGDQASRVADVLAASANKAMGDVTDMAEALKYVGPVAAQMGLGLEDTAGAIAELAQQGILGSQAGTSLRGMLTSLTSPSKLASKTMTGLGISMYDTQGKFVGFDGVAGQLQSTLSGLTDQQRDVALGNIFGNEQITAARILYAGGAEDVQKWTAAVTDSGFAAEQAATLTDNLSGDIEALKGSLETAFIGTGESSQGPLRATVQNLTDVVNGYSALPGPAKSAAGAALGLTAAIGGGTFVFAKAVGGLAAMQTSLVNMGVSAEKAATSTKVLGRVGVGAAGLGLFAAGLASTNKAMAALETTAGGAALGFSVGGPWGAAVGGAIGLITGLAKSHDDTAESVKATAATFDTETGAITANTRVKVAAKLQNEGYFDTLEKLGINTEVATDAVMGQVAAQEQLNAALDKADPSVLTDSLSSLQAQYGDTQGQATFNQQQEAAQQKVDSLSAGLKDQSGQFKDSAENAKQLAGAVSGAGSASFQTAQQVDDTAKALDEARKAAESTAQGFFGLGDSLNDSKVSLDGWIDNLNKQAQALANFRKNAKDAAENGLRKGLIQALKDAGPEGAMRLSQLADASDEQIGRANKAWKRGQNQIESYVNETAKVPPIVTTNVTADATQAKSVLTDVKGKTTALGRMVARVLVEANTNPAKSAIAGVRAELASLKDKTIYVNVRRPNAGGMGPQLRARGGAIYGPGTSTSDSIPAALSNGEYVVKTKAVNRYGVAMMDAINQERFATGGLAGFATGGKVRTARRQPIVVDADDPRYNAPDGKKAQLRYFKDFEHDAKKALGGLQHSLAAATVTVDANKDAVDRETSARDGLQSSFDNLSSSITGMLTSDLFGGGSGNPFSASASSDPISILMSDIAGNKQFQDLFAGLRAEGLHGGALTAAAQGGIAGLQTLSAYNPEQIAQFQQLFDIREQQGAATGQQVAQAQFGQALAEANTKADIANGIAAQSLVQQAAIEAAIRNQEQTVKQSSALVEKATKDISSTAAKGGRSKTRKNR